MTSNQFPAHNRKESSQCRRKRGPMSPELVLGTAQFETSYGVVRESIGAFDACQILELATSLGITSLDTAPGYGNAQAIIGDCSWQGAIHTKIAGDQNVHHSLTDSLLDLRRHRVEVAYFHDPNVLQRDESFFEQTHRTIVPELTEHLGVSVYTSDEFDTALGNSFIDVIQAPINVVDRRITDEQLEQAVLTGKLVFARSIFLQGTLLRDSSSLPDFLSTLAPTIDRLDAISSDTGVNRMEIMMQSVLVRPGISGVVVGAEAPAQLVDIAAAFKASPLPEAARSVVESLRVDDVGILDPRIWPKK